MLTLNEEDNQCNKYCFIVWGGGNMLTVEQYISQMKKKDKLAEFDFQNHAENMTTVIKYVMDYFNNYLNPELMTMKYQS